MTSHPLATLVTLLAISVCLTAAARVTFLKMTNLEYSGVTYYTLRNLSLYECRRWCREEQDCIAASFHYVVTPLAPIVETTCHLQNETQARKPSVPPRSMTNSYYLIKIYLKAEKTCDRLWSFERYPNRMVRGLDNAIVFTSDPESCLAACTNEERFTCRSAEFNYVTLECHLSEFDLRSRDVQVHIVDSQGMDYFENSCVQSEQVCTEGRAYGYPQVGLPQTMIRNYVSWNYYPDKQVLVSSRDECLRQCTTENAFVCRSLYFSPDASRPGKSVCILYHLDHYTFPEGADVFRLMSSKTMLDSSRSSGVYLESQCDNGTASYEPKTSPSVYADVSQQTTTSSLLDDEERDPSCDDYGVCFDVSIKCTDRKIVVNVQTNRPFHGRVYALGRSETCNSNILNGQKFELDVSLTGQDCNTQSMGGVYTNTVVLQHHNVVLTKADKVYNVRCTYETTSRNVTFGMIPVSMFNFRDPDTYQVTSAPEAPQPKIVIFGSDGREASTVRIGDKLTFHIKIPENTPYGIFARSCVAMAKDARSTFEIVDERGCPVDSTIFPGFVEVGNALESTYEAFRFTESYGVIFQCNVKYCIGKCEPAMCTTNMGREESWGRRKRSPSTDEMTLSHEILVLDFGDDVARSMTEKSHSANETFTVRESVTYLETCASRTSIFALAVTSSLLLILYICTVGYFMSQRRNAGMKGFH